MSEERQLRFVVVDRTSRRFVVAEIGVLLFAGGKPFGVVKGVVDTSFLGASSFFRRTFIRRGLFLALSVAGCRCFKLFLQLFYLAAEVTLGGSLIVEVVFYCTSE